MKLNNKAINSCVQKINNVGMWKISYVQDPLYFVW